MTGTLNRAEWVKFLGLFFNMEKEASMYFDTVKAQYTSMKVRLAGQNWQPWFPAHEHDTRWLIGPRPCSAQPVFMCMSRAGIVELAPKSAAAAVPWCADHQRRKRQQADGRVGQPLPVCAR
jgi:hypothetical protein